MKKALFALLIVAAVAAAWFVTRGGGHGPAVAAALPAAQTAGLAGATSLDGLARRWLPLAHYVPGADGLPDPAVRIDKFGFDPLDAKGWETIGIRASSGVAIVADARMGAGRREPVPILLVDIRDRTKLIGWLNQKTGADARIEGSPPVEHLVIDGGKLAMGRRGDYTAIVLAPDARLDDPLRAGFAAFIADDGPALAQSERWRGAMAEAEAPVLFAFGDGPGFGSLASGMGAPVEATAAIDYYARLFPAVAGWAGEQGGARLSTSEAGQALMRRLVVPQRRPPAFARFIPPTGWSALRLSVNLTEALDAAIELVPPSLGEVGSQIRKAPGMVRLALPFAVGASWDDIGAALSGHVVFAIDGVALGRGSPTEGDGLALLGVADEAKADALLGKALAAMKKLPGAAAGARPIEVGGHAGHAIGAMGRSMSVVRVDDVILVGPSEVVEAAIGRKEHLEGAGADAIDGEVVVGAWVDLAPYVTAGDPQLDAFLAEPPMAAFKESPQVAYRLTLDRAGLLASADAPVALDTLMVGAGVAMMTEFVHAAPPPEETGRPMGAAERFLRED